MYVMNEKWFLLDISEIEKKLKTNAASGLPRKAARSRLRRDGKNEVFYIRKRSVSACARRVLSDPMVLLMIGVDIIAAVFGKADTAIVCAVLIALNLFIAIFSYVKASRISESMAEYSQPKVTVIREGTPYYADSRAIVRGDVILLGPGDIIPCDARIVSCVDFKVSCYEGEHTENEEKTVSKKANSVYYGDTDPTPLTCDNMVHAGSHVVCGTARVIAVETGIYTYIGALDGGIPLNNTSDNLPAIKQLRKISKNYSFILMALILPLTVVGIFTIGTQNILDTFMMVMAVAVSSLGELTYVIGAIIVSSGLLDLASNKKGPAVIKNIEVLDKISAPDYLFLLDDAALSDGSYRVTRIVTGDGDFEGKGIFARETVRFSELVMLCEYARSKNPSFGLSQKRPLFDAVSSLGERVGVDKTSFKIRTKNAVYFPPDKNGTESASLALFGERVRVFISHNAGFFERCAFIKTQKGTIPIDAEIKTEILQILDEIECEGSPIMICASSNTSGENGLILEGIAAFTQNSTSDIAKARENLEASGIKILAVLYSEKAIEISQTAKMLGISDMSRIARYSEFSGNADVLAEDVDKYGIIAGFSKNALKKLITELKKRKKNVMVARITADAAELSELADVTVSYGISPYVTSGIDFTKLEASVDSGSAHSCEGAQTLRCTSDVLVRRANVKGGGLYSIGNMIRTSKGIHINLKNALTYLICIQSVRTLIAAIASVASGIIMMTPAQLLFSGLVIDLGAAITCAQDRYSSPKDSKLICTTKNILSKVKIPLISAVAAAAATITAALTVSYLLQTDVTRATFMSVMLLQLMLLFAVRYKEGVKRLFSPIACATSVLSIAVSVAVAAIPPMATLLGSSIGSPYSFIIVPVAPIVFFAVYFSLNAIKGCGKGI